MPIQDTTIKQYIEDSLIAENDKREDEHKSSGKLSASMLYQPVRFQLLKTLGIPRRKFDSYALAKFKRGRDVEDWFVEQLKGAGVLIEDEATLNSYSLQMNPLLKEDSQPMAEYRGAIGYIDSVIDTDKMQAKKGIIPNEIKSVTNMKMKRVTKTGVDWHYKIQACFYALAMGVDHYGVTIVSAEDLRSELFIFQTKELKNDIDKAISDYMVAVENYKKDRSLPKFEVNPKVKWTGIPKYAMFDETWVTAPDSWVLQQIERINNEN